MLLQTRSLLLCFFLSKYPQAGRSNPAFHPERPAGCFVRVCGRSSRMHQAIQLQEPFSGDMRALRISSPLPTSHQRHNCLPGAKGVLSALMSVLKAASPPKQTPQHLRTNRAFITLDPQVVAFPIFPSLHPLRRHKPTLPCPDCPSRTILTCFGAYPSTAITRLPWTGCPVSIEVWLTP